MSLEELPPTLPGGIAGLQFINDLASLIKNKWVENNGGAKPQVYKSWELKQTGMADNFYDVIILTIDSENPKIFSMLQGNGGIVTASNYDWYHEVSITLDIKTGKSEKRVLDLTSEALRIIKTNVVPIPNDMNNTQGYIQMLPEGLTSANEDYRNLWRYMLSVSCQRINP